MSTFFPLRLFTSVIILKLKDFPKSRKKQSLWNYYKNLEFDNISSDIIKTNEALEL